MTARQAQPARRLAKLATRRGQRVEHTGDHPRVANVFGPEREAVALTMRVKPPRVGGAANVQGKPDAQPEQGLRAVVSAVAVGLALRDQAAKPMAQANRRLGLVAVLTTRAVGG